ncbi:GGDEF domain-containing protein [Mycolicibacterium sp. 018/SC-01/001]|uniref:GGDEF domain-containing protein n=1 Tax=Mycolicibacterium sp. 018/SC-01/001 TaxID=2592069 RepID=UPI00117FA0AC|nr:GGDEF domain-containing protein [Mycolicibacterium sp. 018/SC-01/001]TRW82811.1 GGDEF domain-containing protein [Mycolicibacterium sp. 018/SC-01/001]
MNHISQWWRQPDRYDWLARYLASRRLLRIASAMMAAIMAVLAVAVVLTTLSPAGPHGAARPVVWMLAAGFAVVAAVYARRWPTRRQSAVFAMYGCVALAVTAVVQSDPHAGLLTCWAFVGLAAYVASAHSPRLLALAVGVALGTAAISAVRMGVDGDVPLGVATLLMSIGGLLTVPFGGQILTRLLWNDAVSTDPLTGLTNRRGFRRSAQAMIIDAARRGPGSFSMVVIDLDAFKRLNDTLGHAVGDRVLVDVAGRLRAACAPGTIAARVGGEEFVVARVCPPREMDMLARRLCAAIAANPWHVTASLGVAGVAVQEPGADTRTVIDRVFAAADMAMYEAKRAGGNQIRISDAA